MQMVWHRDKAADRPAVSGGSGLEFGAQNGDGWIVGEDRTAARDAGRHEIDGGFDPYRIETTEALMESQRERPALRIGRT
jgi:hypothetical protein